MAQCVGCIDVAFLDYNIGFGGILQKGSLFLSVYQHINFFISFMIFETCFLVPHNDVCSNFLSKTNYETLFKKGIR
jgi:hypothetical protein